MAHFKGEGKFVRHGDIVCVKMSSGKIGRYELYSLVQTSREGWNAIGKLVGYKEVVGGGSKGIVLVPRPRVFVDTSVKGAAALLELPTPRPSRFDKSLGWP